MSGKCVSWDLHELTFIKCFCFEFDSYLEPILLSDTCKSFSTSPHECFSSWPLSQCLRTRVLIFALDSTMSAWSKKHMARDTLMMEMPLLEDDSSEDETIFVTQSSTRSQSSFDGIDLSPRFLHQRQGPNIRKFCNFSFKIFGIIVTIVVILAIIVIIVINSQTADDPPSTRPPTTMKTTSAPLT